MEGPDDKDPTQPDKDSRLNAALRFSRRHAETIDIDWPKKKRTRKKKSR